MMTEKFSLSEEEVEDGFILTCKSHPTTENISCRF